MVDLMAGTKTIYNSNPLECFTELLIREHGIKFDSNFVTTEITSVTSDTVSVRMKGLAQAPSGLAGRWRNQLDYRFRKLDLSLIVPPDLAYSGLYPVTAKNLFAELGRTFDLVFDDTDLELVTSQSVITLQGDVMISAQPNAKGQLMLRTRNTSQRFIGGKSFPLYITGATATEFQPLTLTGDAPNSSTGTSYNYQYVVGGGRAPYTFEILSGTAPTPLDPATGRLSGTYTATGNLSWIVRVTDSRGFTVDLADSATISLTGLAFQTNAVLPAGTTSMAYDQPIVVLGGTPPYRYEVLGELPLGMEFNDARRLAGKPDKGNYTIPIKVTDQVGATLTRNFTLAVAGRNNYEVARSILNKIDAWFEFRRDQYQENDPIEATFFRTGIANTLTVRGGNAVAGGDHIKLDGQYLEGQQNFRNDMFVSVGYRSTNSRAGAGIIGRATSQLGWQLYADNADASKLRYAVTVDSTPFSVLTDAGDPINNGQFTLLSGQRSGLEMFAHRNGKLIGRSSVVEKPIDPTTSVPMRTAARTSTTVADVWKTDLYSVMFSSQRFWTDELEYLYGAGNGRTYAQTVVDAQL